MPEVPDYIARAIEAQGKTTVAEVAAAVDEIDLDEPEPRGEEPEWEPLPLDLDQEPVGLDELEEDRGYEP